MIVPHAGLEAASAFLFLSGAGLAVLVSAMHCDEPGTGVNADVKPLHPRTPVPLSSDRCLPELLVADKQRVVSLAAWSQLSTRMSHELRTPLNAVLGFSELMENEVFGPLGSERYRAYAHDIHESGRKLLKSAEDALAITALLTGQDRQASGRSANVAAIGAEALSFHAEALRQRGIDARCTIDPRLEILAEAQALRQILINLAGHAGEKACEGARIEIAAFEQPDRIAVAVSIDGPAISQNTSDSFALLLARTIVELTGSRLQIDSSDPRRWTAQASFIPASQGDFFIN